MNHSIHGDHLKTKLFLLLWLWKKFPNWYACSVPVPLLILPPLFQQPPLLKIAKRICCVFQCHSSTCVIKPKLYWVMIRDLAQVLLSSLFPDAISSDWMFHHSKLYFPDYGMLLQSLFCTWNHLYLKYCFLMPSASIQNDTTFEIDICIILNQEGMNNTYDKLNPIKQWFLP